MTPTHRKADAETKHQGGQSRLSLLTNSALSEMSPKLASHEHEPPQLDFAAATLGGLREGADSSSRHPGGWPVGQRTAQQRWSAWWRPKAARKQFLTAVNTSVTSREGLVTATVRPSPWPSCPKPTRLRASLLAAIDVPLILRGLLLPAGAVGTEIAKEITWLLVSVR
jgi:hypothetical protein